MCACVKDHILNVEYRQKDITTLANYSCPLIKPWYILMYAQKQHKHVNHWFIGQHFINLYKVVLQILKILTYKFVCVLWVLHPLSFVVEQNQTSTVDAADLGNVSLFTFNYLIISLEYLQLSKSDGKSSSEWYLTLHIKALHYGT